MLVELCMVAGSAALLIAGVSKVAAPKTLTRGVVTVLHVGNGTARFSVLVLGATEVIVATAMHVHNISRYAAVAGLGIGLAIAGFTILSRLQGNAIECGCFGGLTAKRIGPSNLIYGIMYLLLFSYLLIGGQDIGATRDGTKLLVLASYTLGLAVVLGHRAQSSYRLLSSGLTWMNR